MDERFAEETRNLLRMWESADRGELRDYLVRDVEDPRINVQSILTRHFLIEVLFPGEFATLRHHELWFSAVMNWLLAVSKRGGPNPQDGPVPLAEIHAAILEGQTEIGTLRIPGFVLAAATAFPREADGARIGDIVETAMLGNEASGNGFNRAWAMFGKAWQSVLADRKVREPLRVIEPACGSANDYRHLHACGIARFLDYRGFDLTPANVANAQEMFPGIDFRVGNALEIDAADKSFDCLFVHDLFEHLSIAGMEQALAEVCRVTRKALCLGFFRLQNSAEHLVVPHKHYYFNTLSLPRIAELLKAHGAAVEPLWVGAVLHNLFETAETHNRSACTVMAWME